MRYSLYLRVSAVHNSAHIFLHVVTINSHFHFLFAFWLYNDPPTRNDLHFHEIAFIHFFLYGTRFCILFRKFFLIIGLLSSDAFS